MDKIAQLQTDGSQSPFDSIRRVNNLGQEYWLARELMGLLGYVEWRNFSTAVKEAKENLELSGVCVTDHFLEISTKSQGRDATDYQLTRLACYHVALACNGKGKPMVAQAKHYFAIKTRQAEIGDSNPSKELLETAYYAIDSIFTNTAIAPELVSGLKLNATISIKPELRPHLESARQLLIESTAQPHQLLTPTEIGKRFGLSAIAVNKLLVEKGLQIPNPKKKSQKDPSYIPTDRGQEFADFTLATGSNNSTTYQQLRWYESVCTFFAHV